MTFYSDTNSQLSTDYIGYILNKFDCLDLIKNTIVSTFTDSNYYDLVEEKWSAGCFVYVANSITFENHYRVYQDIDLKDYDTISEALDDYLRETALTDEISSYELVEVVDDIIPELRGGLDYLQLLEDFTDNYGDITDYDAHRLKVVLKTHLGYKIYERGLGLLRQEFDTAFYDAITTLQRAVRRKIEKRQAKKVLEQKLKNIDCSISILPLISEWI